MSELLPEIWPRPADAGQQTILMKYYALFVILKKRQNLKLSSAGQTILMKYHALFVILKKRQNLKLLSAASYRWHFKG